MLEPLVRQKYCPEERALAQTANLLANNEEEDEKNDDDGVENYVQKPSHLPGYSSASNSPNLYDYLTKRQKENLTKAPKSSPLRNSIAISELEEIPELALEEPAPKAKSCPWLKCLQCFCILPLDDNNS
jgi:hypothetical protein